MESEEWSGGKREFGDIAERGNGEGKTEMVKIGRIVVGAYQTNCYFVYDEEQEKQYETARPAIVVDPGDRGRDIDEKQGKPAIVIDPGDRGRDIYDKLTAAGFCVAAILLTHGHFDHIWGVEALKSLANAQGQEIAANAQGQVLSSNEREQDASASGRNQEVQRLRPSSNEGEQDASARVLVYAPAAEAELLADTHLNVSLNTGRPCTVIPDVLLHDGDIVKIAGIRFRMMETPGHTAGSACYYFEDAGLCVCGDTIFRESVGRTDFPTGDERALLASIRDKIFALPDDTLLYPGHGEATDVGREKRYNPFVNS